MADNSPRARESAGRRRVLEAAFWAAAVVVAGLLVVLGRTGASSTSGVSFIATGRPEGTPFHVEPESQGEPAGTVPPGGLVIASPDHEHEGWAFIREVRNPASSGDDILPFLTAYAPNDELRAASLDQIGHYGLQIDATSDVRFRAGWTESYRAWFGTHGDTEWTALEMDPPRRGGSAVWVYRRREDGQPQVEFSRTLPGHSVTMVATYVKVLPTAAGGGPPAVAYFYPRPVLALYRWNGQEYRQSFVWSQDVPTLLEVVLVAHMWWVLALLGYLAIWGVALRGLLRPASAALVFLVWAGTFLAFPVFFLLNLIGIAVLSARPDVGFLRKALGTVLIMAVALLLMLAAIPVMAE